MCRFGHNHSSCSSKKHVLTIRLVSCDILKVTNRIRANVGQCTFFARSGRQFSNRHGEYFKMSFTICINISEGLGLA